jgi:hypothetical protein
LALAFRAEDIRYENLPAEFRQALAAQGIPAQRFPVLVRMLQQLAQTRLEADDKLHLAYFVLQSNSFTKRPRIEPALSARDFVEKLEPAERERFLRQQGATSRSTREKIPAAVLARIADFVRSSEWEVNDRRLFYFSWTLSTLDPEQATMYLREAYLDAMWFLYHEEWEGRGRKPAAAGESMAALYRERGYSTDTEVETNYAVREALAVLKSLAPKAQLNQVLVVGPGLDIAPRRALNDAFDPQSYQPFAVADALLGLKLADAARLQVQCVDLSPIVVGAINDFSLSKKPKLNLVSARRKQDLAPEFADYFRALGNAIGTETPIGKVPPALDSHWKKALAVRREVVRAVTAAQLDIVTGRLAPSPGYDLVIVTNVFPGFSAVELMLALTNISAMMKPGAYLVHNEWQAEMNSLGRALGVIPIQSRTLRLSGPGVNPPLSDSFVVQQKK